MGFTLETEKKQEVLGFDQGCKCIQLKTCMIRMHVENELSQFIMRNLGYLKIVFSGELKGDTVDALTTKEDL